MDMNERLPAEALEAIGRAYAVLFSISTHPTSACLGRMCSLTSECPICRLRAHMETVLNGVDAPLLNQLAKAEAAIARVRKLHFKELQANGCPVCGICRNAYEDPVPWPCPTIQALEGTADA